MRYYDLLISDPTSGAIIQHWTSNPGGIFDPNALDISFDIIVKAATTPDVGQIITVYGPSVDVLRQAINYAGPIGGNGFNLVLSGGMSGGLPLESPQQLGVLTGSAIYESFGNWVGTDMSVTFVTAGGYYTASQPANFTLRWMRGTPLVDALRTCLQTAYAPVQGTVRVDISPDIVASQDIVHSVTTFAQMARFVYRITQNAAHGPVHMAVQAAVVTAYDGSSLPAATPISFTDLIGQPVWIAPLRVNIKCVLRADIQVMQMITLPPGFATLPGLAVVAPSVSQMRSNYTTFTGQMQVLGVRHIGRFRSPDAQEWCTILQCTPAQQVASGITTTPLASPPSIQPNA